MIDVHNLELRLDESLNKLLIANGFSKKQQGGYFALFAGNIVTISRSQIRTLGVFNNRFEYTIGGNCSILEIENIWKDLRPLVNPKLDDKVMQSYIEKQVPLTYSIGYDKDIVKEKYSNCVQSSGWLSFEITDHGLVTFKEVLTYIVEELLIPSLKNQPSIAQLDKNVNSRIELDKLDSYSINKEGFIYRRIILAKLNNNELFEDICNYHRQGFDEYIDLSKRKGYEYFKNIPVVFEKVYKRLKNLESS